MCMDHRATMGYTKGIRDAQATAYSVGCTRRFDDGYAHEGIRDLQRSHPVDIPTCTNRSFGRVHRPCIFGGLRRHGQRLSMSEFGQRIC